MPWLNLAKRQMDTISHPYGYEDTNVFDLQSIMHYDSSVFINRDKPSTPENAPLVKWRGGGPNFTPPAKSVMTMRAS
jgi:hypothetical protein